MPKTCAVFRACFARFLPLVIGAFMLSCGGGINVPIPDWDIDAGPDGSRANDGGPSGDATANSVPEGSSHPGNSGPGPADTAIEPPADSRPPGADSSVNVGPDAGIRFDGAVDRAAPAVDAAADRSIVDSGSAVDATEAAIACPAATPNRCGASCVDFQTDPNNCGRCSNFCPSFGLPNQPACVGGVCDMTMCPPLGTQEACTSCGNKGCTAANTVLTCDVGTSCTNPVCQAGFANCGGTGVDCATPIASAPASCFPSYLDTAPIGVLPSERVTTAIAPDGSYFLFGDYSGVADFDPSAAMDDRFSVGTTDGFVTKLNADGSYAWTRTFGGAGAFASVSRGVLGPDGSIVLTGSYAHDVDFDPGPGAAVRTAGDDARPYVLKLSAAGAFVWVQTFEVPGSSLMGNGTGVAVAADGSLVATGWFIGSIDLNPGTGADLHDNLAGDQRAFIVALDANGVFRWSRAFTGCFSTGNAVVLAPGGNALVLMDTACGDSEVSVAIIAPNGSDVTTVPIARGSGTAIAIGSDGAVHVAGISDGTILAPLAGGVAERTFPAGVSGGFVLKLDPSGVGLAAQTITAVNVKTIAALADGGLLVAGQGDFAPDARVDTGMFITKLDVNYHSRWTIAPAVGSSTPTDMGVSATGFIVVGYNGASADFDPGPGVDVVPGQTSFITRYAF